MHIEYKRLREGAILPMRGSDGAAGYDLFAATDALVHPQAPAILIPTGIAMHIKDPNVVALICPRSGLGHKMGLICGNGTGVIDSDYQGELFVSAWNRNPPFIPKQTENGDAEIVYNEGREIVINRGDRIAQLLFMPIHVGVTFSEVSEFEASERAAGGFGSTGK